MTLDDVVCAKSVVNRPINHYRKSALMSAVHILIYLTEGKRLEDIAKDFDDNIEQVRVWIDYMIGINWISRNAVDGTLLASDNGKSGLKNIIMLHNVT